MIPCLSISLSPDAGTPDGHGRLPKQTPHRSPPRHRDARGAHARTRAGRRSAAAARPPPAAGAAASGGVQYVRGTRTDPRRTVRTAYLGCLALNQYCTVRFAALHLFSYIAFMSSLLSSDVAYHVFFILHTLHSNPYCIVLYGTRYNTVHCIRSSTI